MAFCLVNFAINHHWIWQNVEQWGATGSSWQKGPQVAKEKKKPILSMCLLHLCMMCANVLRQIFSCSKAHIYFLSQRVPQMAQRACL